jgi:hypothetical protein
MTGMSTEGGCEKGYRVEWLKDAVNELAAAWCEAHATGDVGLVTQAENLVDGLLERFPHLNGMPVGEGLYRLTVAPLIIYYSIDHGDCVVTVSNVKLVRAR